MKKTYQPKQYYEGAGFIYLTPDHTVLMLQKENKKWTFPGGHAEIFEEPLETATRESIEELGIQPKGKTITYFKYTKPDAKIPCFSFLMLIKSEFKPKLSSEHLNYKWVSLDEINKLIISKSVAQIIPLLKGFLTDY